MPAKTPALADFRRIVVKVGSSLLVDSAAGRIRETWLASLAEDIARLHGEKRDVIVVSSGAIALGRAVLKLPKGPLKLEEHAAQEIDGIRLRVASVACTLCGVRRSIYFRLDEPMMH